MQNGINIGNINDIEKHLNVHIDVVSNDNENLIDVNNDLPFTFSESKTGLVLTVAREFTSMYADIYVGSSFITKTKIGRKGQIKIPKRSDIGQTLMRTASSQQDIKIFLKDF